MLQRSPAARTAAPGRTARRRPRGRRIGGCRSRCGLRSRLRSRLRSSLGLRLGLPRGALLRHDALLLTRRRGFSPRLSLFGLRLRLLRFLRHGSPPDRCGFATVTLPARLPPRWIPASRRAPRVRGLRSPSRSARRCGRPGSWCPQRSASCSRYCRQRSRRA
jgi:hypothetical protein